MLRTCSIILMTILANAWIQIAWASVDKSGVKPQVISLPKGPGSIEGLGESFEPQLNSGTTTYAVKLKAPPGRAGFEPGLTLRYNGGNANGPLGLSWTMSMQYIQRQTDKGLPDYDGTDTFIAGGGEELVPIGGGVHRHENEGAFMRYVRSGEGWTARNKSGVLYKYGMRADTQIRSGEKIYRWLLEEMVDTNGNKIQYGYSLLDSGPQRYCTRISYNENGAGQQEIILSYESRPDVFPDYRSTFRIDTAFRCKSITMLTGGQMVRRYDLAYGEDQYVSLLKSVAQVGRDGTSTLPPATFTYTRFDPSKARVITIEGREDNKLPPFLIMAYEPDLSLSDMNADGLPDLLLAKGGDHQVFLNQGIVSDGKHRWGERLEMGPDSPGESLGNNGASLADIDGDGKTDFIARRSSDTYFLWRNLGTGKWGPTETFADKSNLPFDFEYAAVRLLDVNNDKHIDVMYCNDAAGETYSFFINDGGAEFSRVLAKSGLGNAMTFDQRPGMKLADMNGDRLQDIVLLQDGVCIYWPSTGVGEWDITQRGDWRPGQAGTGTKMQNPPDSEADDEPGLYYDWPGLMFVDMNGDGLSDVLYAPEGAERIVYWLNRGSVGFEGPLQVENVPVRLGNTSVQPGDMNGNGTTDILWNFPEDTDINRDQVWQYLEFCPDEKPYLLKTATNGIGKTITFHYSTTTKEYVRDREAKNPWPTGVPNATTVLSMFRIDDGQSVPYQTEITYHDGYYDGEEKEFRGFASAEKNENGDPATAPDLIMAYTYNTGVLEDALKGKPLKVEVRTKSGDVFYREEHIWATRVLENGADGDTRKVTFPYQTSKTRNITEKGLGTPVQLKWEYEYDHYGNMTKQLDHGRMDSGWDDERVTESTFTAGYPDGLTNWMLGKVVEQVTKDETGAVVARKRNFYDGNTVLGKVSKGNLTMAEDWVKDDDWVKSVRNDYDAYGNIIAIYDPLYGSGLGHYRELTYDSIYHTFPVRESIHTGALTLTMSATYDYSFGKMLTSTGYNGHTATYDYDTFGRIIAITKPPDRAHTVEYDYKLAHDLGGGKMINWVETRQQDGSTGDVFLKSRTFYDGLGRKVMTRADGEDPGQIVVTDTVKFNARKKAWKKYLPYFETGALDYVDPTYNTGFTEHIYDALGREIRTNQPVGPEGKLHSLTTYAPLSKIIHDEEQTRAGSAHANCGMRYVEDGLLNKDGKGRLREVFEIVKVSDAGKPLDSPVEWKTVYTYDLLDNLTGYTDSQNNQKTMTYDGLGRKTYMDDPDRGRMTYTYDDAGNLVQTVDAKNQVIKYEYDGVNRLTGEYYGNGKTEPDVEYHYDAAAGPVDRGEFWGTSPAKEIADAVLMGTSNEAYDWNDDGKIDVADVVDAARSGNQESLITAENTKGFLSWVRDQSGEEHNSYDKRGRVAWVVKRIAGTGPTDLRNFYSGMEYDPMDRVTQLTYPDGTSVSYKYDTRGLLESVPGVIDAYDYNPAGQNDLLSLACGIETTYEYDHRLRLTGLKTDRATTPLVLQDLNYTYDGVSNITAITDKRSDAGLVQMGAELGIAAAEARKFNGTQAFSYDSLYRLTRASNGAVYGTIDYRYDRIGNMVHKDAALTDIDPLMDLRTMKSGGSAGTSWRIGRAAGDPPGPHAITGTEKGPGGLAMAFTYDDNGNMLTDRGMTLNWDHKDRLTGLINGAKTAVYAYDYSDTRKKKVVMDSGDGATSEVLYVDKFSEVRKNGKLTKYVYAGSSRVARSDVVSPRLDFEVSSFYLHDHLGSTSLSVSDEAVVREQMVNYPFGRQRMGHTGAGFGYAADYEFTGKERDGESGLQYFEARYYDAVVGKFVSVDPLLIASENGDSPLNPQLFSLYSYALNKPLLFIDTSGLEPTRKSTTAFHSRHNLERVNKSAREMEQRRDKTRKYFGRNPRLMQYKAEQNRKKIIDQGEKIKKANNTVNTRKGEYYSKGKDKYPTISDLKQKISELEDKIKESKWVIEQGFSDSSERGAVTKIEKAEKNIECLQMIGERMERISSDSFNKENGK